MPESIAHGSATPSTSARGVVERADIDFVRMPDPAEPPDAEAAHDLFNSCAAHGGKARDHSARVRALEKLADFGFGRQRGLTSPPPPTPGGGPTADLAENAGDEQPSPFRFRSQA